MVFPSETVLISPTSHPGLRSTTEISSDVNICNTRNGQVLTLYNLIICTYNLIIWYMQIINYLRMEKLNPSLNLKLKFSHR